MKYYMVVGNDRKGPFAPEELTAQGAGPDTLVWREGMPDWVPAASVEELRSYFSAAPGYPPQPGYAAPPGYNPANSNRVPAGVCAILLGSLGVHKFILGMTTPGLIMLLGTLVTCGFGGIVTGTIGLIEGIIYLTKSDPEFYQLYQVEKKPWF